MREKDREKVKEWADIEKNLKTINENKDYYNKLLKNGKCIVAYECNGEYLFGPSRFVGYKDNDESHENKPKDGGLTNTAITKILGEPRNRSEFNGLDEKFIEFLKKRGLKPADKNREYWLQSNDQNKCVDDKQQLKGNKEFVNNKKLEIRILPMSRTKEFFGWTIEEVQEEYFLKNLIEENGYYYYRKAGMKVTKGSLVLFQFDNAIIAGAKVLDIEKFKKPISKQYNGAYVFDVTSIIVFEPITFDELYDIDKSISRFSQSKQKISYSCFNAIFTLIRRKQNPLFAEELSSQEALRYTEGTKKQIVVNAYERNYKARQECLKHHGNTCSICGFSFENFYGEEFRGKIHVHHIKALAEIDQKYEVDPIKDLIPVCPNCHLAFHSKSGNEVYSIEELKKFIQRQRKRI